MQLLLVASIYLAFRSEVSAQPPFEPPFSRFPFDYGPPGYRPTPPPPPVGYGPVPFDRQRPPMPTPAMDGSPFPGDRYMDQEERRPHPSMQGRRRSNPGSYDTVDPRGSRESFDMPDRRDIHQRYQDTSGTLDIRRMRQRDQIRDSHDIVDPRSRTRYPQDSGDRYDRQISRLSVQDSRDQYDTSREQYPTTRDTRRNPTTRDRAPYDVRRSFREPVDRRRYGSPNRIDMSDPRRFRSQSYLQTDSDFREPRPDTFRYRQSQSNGRRPGGRGAFRFSPGRIVVDRQNLINRNENIRQQSDGRMSPQRQQRVRINRLPRRNRQRNERVSRMPSQRQQRGERINSMPSQSQQRDERMSSMSSQIQHRDERINRISSQSQQRDERMSRISSQSQQRDERVSRMLSQSQQRDERTSRMPSQREQRDERIFGLISKQSVAMSAGQTIRYAPTVENNRPNTNRGGPRGNELNDRRPFRRLDRKPTKSVRLARDPFMRNRLSRRRGRRPQPEQAPGRSMGNRPHVDRPLAADKSMSSSGKQQQNNHFTQMNAAVPSNRLKHAKPFDDTVMDLRPNALIGGKKDVKRKRGHKGNKIHMSKNPPQVQNNKLINAPVTGTGNAQKHGGARKSNALIDNNINFPSAPKQVNQLPRVVRKSDIILMNNVPKEEASHSSRGSAGEIKVITKKAKPTVSLKEVKSKQLPETKKTKVSVPKPRVVEQKGLNILAKRIPKTTKQNKIIPVLPPGSGSSLVTEKRKSSGKEHVVDGQLSQRSDIGTMTVEKYVEKNEQILPQAMERKPEIVYKPETVYNPKVPATSIAAVKQTPKPTKKPITHKKEVIRNEELRNIEVEGPSETKPGRGQPPKSIIKGSPNFDVFVLNVNDPAIPQDVKNLVPKGTSPEIIRALSRVLSETTFQKDIKPANEQPRAKIVVNTRPLTSGVQSGQPNHAVHAEPTAKLVVTTRPPRQTTTTKPSIDMKELLSLIQENKVSEAMKLMSQSNMAGIMPQNNGQRHGVNSYSQQRQNSNNMYNRFNYNPNPFSSGLFGNDIFGGLMANKLFEGSLEGLF